MTMVGKYSLFILAVCLLGCICCSQNIEKNEFSKIEVKPDLDDDFFNLKAAFSQTPSSIKIYRNDTLVSESNYDSVEERDVNAFVEDRYHKRLGFDECSGVLEKDTIVISLRNDLAGYFLAIIISNGNFSSSFIDKKMSDGKWVLVNQHLILNKGEFKKSEAVKCLIEAKFALIDGGLKKDSVLFYGPFFCKVP